MDYVDLEIAAFPLEIAGEFSGRRHPRRRGPKLPSNLLLWASNIGKIKACMLMRGRGVN